MRVLYLTVDDVESPLGKSQILAYLQAMQTLNDQIVFDLIYFSKSRKDAWAIQPAINLIPIKRANNELGLLISYWRMYQTINAAIKSEKYNVIHCRSYPSRVILHLLYGARFKAKTLFDIRGLWFDERLDFNTSKLKRLILTTAKYLLEKRLYLNSGHIVTLSHKAIDYLKSAFPALPKNGFEVIYCAADYDKFSGIVQSKNPPYLLFSGSLGRYYPIKYIVDFYDVLKTYIPALELHIVSSEWELAMQYLEKQQHNQNGIKCYASNFESMPQIVSGCLAGLMLIEPTLAKIASYPTKLSEFIFANKPVFYTPQVGDLDALNRQFGFGIPVGGFNETEYHKAAQLFQIKHSEAGNTFSFAQIKPLIDLQQAALKYLDIYKKLAHAKS